MRITALKQGNDEEKVAIYIDGRYSFSVVKDTILQENLYVGKELDEQQQRKLVETDIRERLWDKSLRQISVRPRSVSELKQFLHKKADEYLGKTAAEAVINSIIEKLQARKYLGDKEFAHWWVENRNMFKGRSRRVLRGELLQKGLSSEIIDEVLETLVSTDDQKRIALDLLSKKQRSLQRKGLTEKEQQLKLRLYLQQKGFAYDLIKEIT